MELPTSYSASSSLPVRGGASPLQSTITDAQQLRLAHPEKYGVKGTRAGDEGYVKNGWRSALRDAAATRRANKQGADPLSAEQQAVHGDYLAELHLLQARYFPRMGRELSNKAKVAAAIAASPSMVALRPAAAVAVAKAGSAPPTPPPSVSPPGEQTSEQTSEVVLAKKSKRLRQPLVSTAPAVSST